MAERPSEPDQERLDRLESQMRAVLSSLERLSERLAPANLSQADIVAPPPPQSQPAPPSPEPVTAVPPSPTPPPVMARPPQPDFTPPFGPAEAPPASGPSFQARGRETEPPRIDPAFFGPPGGQQPSESARGGVPFDDLRAGAGPERAEAHARSSRNAEAHGRPTGNKVDWEDVIGRQWALWVGAIAVILSIGFFLAYAWSSLSETGRLAVGAVSGMALILCAEMTRKRTTPGFSEGLVGAGLAILYLDAWASSARYHLAPFDLALVMMIAVTAVGVLYAVRYDSTGLHGLATLGGFAAPAMLGTGSGSGSMVPFLSYVTVLNAGVLAVAVAKQWRTNVLFGALATVALLIGWAEGSAWAYDRWLVFTFVTLNYLMYAAAAAFPSIARHATTEPEDWLLLVSATGFYFVAGHGLIHNLLGAVPGAFPIALAVFFSIYAIVARLQSPADRPLTTACIGIACSLAAIAVPIQLRQGWVSVGWSAEAAVLLTLAAVTGSVDLRRAGQVIWGLAAIAVLNAVAGGPITTLRLVFNEHGIPLLAFALSSFWASQVSRGRREDDLRPWYAMAWVAAGGWLVGEQVQFGFTARIYSLPSAWVGGEPFLVAMALSVYAAAVYCASIGLHDFMCRAATLGVLAASTALTLGASATETDVLWKPVVNPRFLAFFLQVLALVGICVTSAREPDEISESERSINRVIVPIAHILVLTAIGWELFAASTSGTVGAMSVAAFLCSYAAMLLLPAFHPDHLEIRWLAWGVAGVGAVTLFANAMTSWTLALDPVVNARFFDFVICAIALVVVAVLSADSATQGEETMPYLAIGLAAFMALWGVTQEVYFAFAFYRFDNWERWAQAAISVVWSTAGAGLLIYGIARDVRIIRLVGLSLVGLAVCKVFLFDLGFLENQSRVLAFGGLGLALIGISWLYSRYGRELEGEGAAAARSGLGTFARH